MLLVLRRQPSVHCNMVVTEPPLLVKALKELYLSGLWYMVQHHTDGSGVSSQQMPALQDL